ncbi:MAG: hypothetical protein ACI8X5_001192 [Planctomycetota bacterium]|jgi:hypothetical protein
MRTKKKNIGDHALSLLSSYGLCCLCLFVLFLLTIFGTLYQRDHGLFEAKRAFFSWDFAPIEINGLTVAYLPGVATTLAVLSVNLITGGLVRIRWQARNVGVIIIHCGIIFMLVAGLVKMTKGTEGSLRLYENQSASSFRSLLLWEVAVWELKAGTQGVEFIIPDDLFLDLDGEGERKFTSSHLPFALTLKGFVKNSQVMPKGPRWQASGEVIEGYGILPQPPNEQAEFNVAGMHAEVMIDGESQRAILHGLQQYPWIVEADGRFFAVDLRHQRYPFPFDIRLEEFHKKNYPGMTMAKSYESLVTRIDDSGDHQVLIQMNEPLRKDGFILFQSSYGPQLPNGDVAPGEEVYSVFSVVHNPSDKWPEYSMWVISLGLLITFSKKLLRYTKRQNAAHAKLAMENS